MSQPPSIEVVGRLVAIGDDPDTMEGAQMVISLPDPERSAQEGEDDGDEGEELFEDEISYRIPCTESDARQFAPFLFHNVTVTVTALSATPAAHPPREE